MASMMPPPGALRPGVIPPPPLLERLGIPEWARTPVTYRQYYYEDRGYQLHNTAIAMTVLAGVFVSLRLMARKLARTGFWWDDWVILACFLLAISQTVQGILMPRYHYGRHTIVIVTEPEIYFGKVSYICTAFLYPILGLTKVGILLMYARIFPVNSFKHGLGKMSLYSKMWYITFVMSIMFGISYAFVFCFATLPVSATWTFPTGPITHRIETLSAQWSSFAFDIFLDLMVLVLPIGRILKLNLRTGQKIILLTIFLVGLFTVFTAIARLIYVGQALGSKDITYVGTAAFTWNVIEVFTGIICACLPVLRPVVTTIMIHSPFGSPKGSRKTTPHSTNVGSNHSQSAPGGSRISRDQKHPVGAQMVKGMDSSSNLRPNQAHDADLESQTTFGHGSQVRHNGQSLSFGGPDDLATTVTTTPYVGGTTIVTTTNLPFETYMAPYTGSTSLPPYSADKNHAAPSSTHQGGNVAAARQRALSGNRNDHHTTTVTTQIPTSSHGIQHIAGPNHIEHYTVGNAYDHDPEKVAYSAQQSHLSDPSVADSEKAALQRTSGTSNGIGRHGSGNHGLLETRQAMDDSVMHKYGTDGAMGMAS